jgi:hypothetical protein
MPHTAAHPNYVRCRAGCAKSGSPGTTRRGYSYICFLDTPCMQVHETRKSQVHVCTPSSGISPPRDRRNNIYVRDVDGVCHVSSSSPSRFGLLFTRDFKFEFLSVKARLVIWVPRVEQHEWRISHLRRRVHACKYAFRNLKRKEIPHERKEYDLSTSFSLGKADKKAKSAPMW